jgi:hypothetical protein
VRDSTPRNLFGRVHTGDFFPDEASCKLFAKSSKWCSIGELQIPKKAFQLGISSGEKEGTKCL